MLTRRVRAGRPWRRAIPSERAATILAAATAEYSRKGLDGARVDKIARRSGVNKRMIYHYFGDKEGLYLAVLEKSYTAIRAAEFKLSLAGQDPVEGMRTLVRFTWKYLVAHPEFLSLLSTENLHRAANLKKLPHIRKLHSPLIGMISEVLQRGVKRKLFRKGVDPMQLYISIAATWLLLSVQQAHPVHDLRPRSQRTRGASRARIAHRRCRARLPARLRRRTHLRVALDSAENRAAL